jgi:hypothetical protein
VCKLKSAYKGKPDAIRFDSDWFPNKLQLVSDIATSTVPVAGVVQEILLYPSGCFKSQTAVAVQKEPGNMVCYDSHELLLALMSFLS